MTATGGCRQLLVMIYDTHEFLPLTRHSWMQHVHPAG